MFIQVYRNDAGRLLLTSISRSVQFLAVRYTREKLQQAIETIQHKKVHVGKGDVSTNAHSIAMWARERMPYTSCWYGPTKNAADIFDTYARML